MISSGKWVRGVSVRADAETVIPVIGKVLLMVAKLLAQQCIAGGLLGIAELVRLLIHAPAAVCRISDSRIDDAVGKKFLYLLYLLRRDGIVFADPEPLELGQPVERGDVSDGKVIAYVEVLEVLEVREGAEVVEP